MAPLTFWLNPPATCPKCLKNTVRVSYIEADNGNAILNYACPTCGMVKTAVIPLTPPDRKPQKGWELYALLPCRFGLDFWHELRE
jgi:hypothetical protein